MSGPTRSSSGIRVKFVIASGKLTNKIKLAINSEAKLCIIAVNKAAAV